MGSLPSSDDKSDGNNSLELRNDDDVFGKDSADGGMHKEIHHSAKIRGLADNNEEEIIRIDSQENSDDVPDMPLMTHEQVEYN